MVLVEAGLMGRAVIGSKLGGIEDGYDTGTTGSSSLLGTRRLSPTP